MTIDEKRIFLLLSGWKAFTNTFNTFDNTGRKRTITHYAWILPRLDDPNKLKIASDIYADDDLAIEWAYNYTVYST